MSDFTITVEIKPSKELVTLFTPLITAIMPQKSLTAKQPDKPTQPVPQYRAPAPQMPVNPMPPQSVTPAIPATPATFPQSAPTPYPSNPAAANPTLASMRGAPVNPATVPQIAPTFPNAANSAMPATPVITSNAPIATPGNAAPTAGAPSFTFEDLARAAAQLMDAGKQQQLLNLLTQFKLQSMQQLPKEQYGEFATALRQMGARI